MTIAEYLVRSTELLKKSDISTARLDSLILIENVTGLSRAKLLANGDLQLSVKHINVLNKLINKRAHHIPVAQLTRSREFYGRNFFINDHVMIPRPETEKMIEIFLDVYNKSTLLKKLPNLAIADVGTGSGVVGITIAKELPQIRVDLIDISNKALKVAKINVVLHTISINVIKSDLLKQTKRNYHVLLCNLPYIPDEFEVDKEVRNDPSIAIFGGKDGLDVYRRLFSRLSETENKPLLIITESLKRSHNKLASITAQADYEQLFAEDFIQVFENANSFRNISG